MTGEEKEQLLKDLGERLPNNPFVKGGNKSDLLNEHHFDYRGLIEIRMNFNA